MLQCCAIVNCEAATDHELSYISLSLLRRQWLRLGDCNFYFLNSKLGESRVTSVDS